MNNLGNEQTCFLLNNLFFRFVIPHFTAGLRQAQPQAVPFGMTACWWLMESGTGTARAWLHPKKWKMSFRMKHSEMRNLQWEYVEAFPPKRQLSLVALASNLFHIIIIISRHSINSLFIILQPILVSPMIFPLN